MYAISPFTGDHLPPKTLCLTYDDGPGEYTLPIARFLFEKGIRATFFVVGKYAIERQSILDELSEMGHIVGNHTYDHPDMPYYASINGDLQNQILRTDAIISAYAKQPIFFRTPYGKWSAEVAAELNTNLLCTLNHTGPIHWDIDGIDCYYWRTGKTLADAISDYKKAIDTKGRGIVVMHDDISDMDIVKPLNQTLALTQHLIPLLQSEGYQFVGLDEVFPHDKSNEEGLGVYLKTTKNQFVGFQHSEQSVVCMVPSGEKAILEVTGLKGGKVALKTSFGMYICQVNDHLISIKETLPVTESQFDLIPIFNNQFMLRAHNGNFVNIDSKTGALTTTAAYMRLATIFIFQPVNQPINNKPISLSMQIKLWKKRLAFIKSKLLSQ